MHRQNGIGPDEGTCLSRTQRAGTSAEADTDPAERVHHARDEIRGDEAVLAEVRQ